MNLYFSNHIKVANKWLILLSGFNKHAIDKNGNKEYEYKYFNIPAEWREVKWSKTVMIKQILAYLGLTNSKGDLGVVDLEELATLLCCSVRSLRNNNKLLVDLGLIKVEYLYGELVHIQLVDYLPNFLDLHKKSTFPNEKEECMTYTGYIRIKKEVLFDMFKMKEVNLLRLVCRALRQHEIEVDLGKNEAVVFDSYTLKGFLPTYFSYRPVIERAVRKIGHLFNVQFFDVKKDKSYLFNNYKMVPSFIKKLKAPYLLSMKLHSSKDSHKVMENDMFNSFAIVQARNVYETTNMYPIDQKSLQEMIVEYGDEVVTKAFEDIINYYNGNYRNITDVVKDLDKDFRLLGATTEPIKILRKIFKKYALSFQEGYLMQF